MSISYGGDNITFPDGSTQNTSPQTGFVNRIINGDMRIDQRNAGASVNVGPSSSAYTLDRWQVIAGGGGGSTVFSAVRDTNAPAGFVNSLKITISTIDSSVGASDENLIRYNIEGNDASDLGWGSANAQPVTLSFRVRSSVIGTFGGAIRNSAATRAFPFVYTINAANTWEYKTITISGDTSGAWSTDNSLFGRVQFDLGSGSSLQGAANVWASAAYVGATGTQSIVGTSGATFYITGVSLVKGSTALPWEFRSIGQELALCQRYYELGNAKWYFPAGGMTTVYVTVSYKITKRSSATLAFNGSGVSGGFNPLTTIETNYIDSFGGSRSGEEANFGWTASAEL